MKKRIIILGLLFALFIPITFECKSSAKTIPSPIRSDDYVGEFFLFSSRTLKDSVYGHAWIGIYNSSNENIVVGNQIIIPGEMCTLGNFLRSFDNDDKGLYVDYECYRQNTSPYNFSKNRYVSEGLTKEDLLELNCYLENTDPNAYDVILNNCCHFAISAWNSCMSEYHTFSRTLFPDNLDNQISYMLTYKKLQGGKDYLLEYKDYKHY